MDRQNWTAFSEKRRGLGKGLLSLQSGFCLHYGIILTTLYQPDLSHLSLLLAERRKKGEERGEGIAELVREGVDDVDCVRNAAQPLTGSRLPRPNRARYTVNSTLATVELCRKVMNIPSRWI